MAAAGWADWDAKRKHKPEESPPSRLPELELAKDCEYWKCLPHKGSLLDQPAGLMSKLRILLNTYNAELLYKRTPSDKVDVFIENYPNEYAIYKYIQELRKQDV